MYIHILIISPNKRPQKGERKTADMQKIRKIQLKFLRMIAIQLYIHIYFSCLSFSNKKDRLKYENTDSITHY